VSRLQQHSEMESWTSLTMQGDACMQELNFMGLSALVIYAENDKPLGDLLAIARAEAMKKHGVKHERVEVFEITHVPRLGVYVAVYKTPEVRGRRLKGEK